MGCFESLSKTVLVLVNLIIALTGLLFLAVGLLFQYGSGLLQPLLKIVLDLVPGLTSGVKLTPETSTTSGIDIPDLNIAEALGEASLIFIIVGAFLFGVSFFACCGVCCKSRCLLVLYVIIVGVIFLGEVAGVTLFFLGMLDTPIQTALNSTLVTHYEGIRGTNPWNLLFNYVMITFECCGIVNYEDFAYCPNWEDEQSFEGMPNAPPMVTPVACCKTNGSTVPLDPLCSLQPNDTISNWKTGCFKALVDSIDNIAIGVCAGILALQAILIIMAIIVIAGSGRERVGQAA